MKAAAAHDDEVPMPAPVHHCLSGWETQLWIAIVHLVSVAAATAPPSLEKTHRRAAPVIAPVRAVRVCQDHGAFNSRDFIRITYIFALQFRGNPFRGLSTFTQ